MGSAPRVRTLSQVRSGVSEPCYFEVLLDTIRAGPELRSGERGMGIEGAWRALRTTATTSNGSDVSAPFGGEHAVGSITFEPNGWMTTVLCDGRMTTDLEGPRQFHAYAGTYHFDGEQFVVKVEVATDPNIVGSQQVRKVRFEGSNMILIPPPRAVEGYTITNEVYWSRLKAQAE